MRLATTVTAGSLRLTKPSARKVSSNAVVMIAISSGEKTPLPKRGGRIGIAPTPQPQVFYHINGVARNAKKALAWPGHDQAGDRYAGAGAEVWCRTAGLTYPRPQR